MSKRDRPNLPIFAIGAGAVHLIALAILLPLLITLPGPGRNAPPKPVNVEVDLGSPAEPKPIVPNVSSMASHDETAALPTGSEPGGETSNPLANVRPHAAPSSQDEYEAAPGRKLKAKVQAKVAKFAAKPAGRAAQETFVRAGQLLQAVSGRKHGALQGAGSFVERSPQLRTFGR